MTKNEMELIQAFADLEKAIALTDKAIYVVEKLSDQKWSYYKNNFSPIKYQLDIFKKKFYNILLDIEEPKE